MKLTTLTLLGAAAIATLPAQTVSVENLYREGAARHEVLQIEQKARQAAAHARRIGSLMGTSKFDSRGELNSLREEVARLKNEIQRFEERQQAILDWERQALEAAKPMVEQALEDAQEAYAHGRSPYWVAAEADRLAATMDEFAKGANLVAAK